MTEDMTSELEDMTTKIQNWKAEKEDRNKGNRMHENCGATSECVTCLVEILEGREERKEQKQHLKK